MTFYGMLSERPGAASASWQTSASDFFVDLNLDQGRGIKMFFVTHLYEFAHALHGAGLAGTLFLRAERRAGGERSFRMVEGEPQRTSHGEDLYRRIFDVRTADPAKARAKERRLSPAA